MWRSTPGLKYERCNPSRDHIDPTFPSYPHRPFVSLTVQARLF